MQLHFNRLLREISFTMWWTLSVIIVLVSSVSTWMTKPISEQKCDQFYSSYGTPQQKFSEPVTSELAKPGEFPYMTALGTKDENGTNTYYCTAVLIDPSYVIGPAHCTLALGINGVSIVRLNVENFSLSEEISDIVTVKKIIVHQNFSRYTKYNNIALYELERQVWKKPVCLWRETNISNNENILLVHDKVNRKFGNLRKVRTKLYPTDECQEEYQNRGETLADTQLCAIESDPKDCPKYSGPLITQMRVGENHIPYLIGFSSFGVSCEVLVAPSIYTRISSYVDWIESTIWNGSQLGSKINFEPIPYLIFLKDYRKYSTPFLRSNA